MDDVFYWTGVATWAIGGIGLQGILLDWAVRQAGWQREFYSWLWTRLKERKGNQEGAS